MTDCPHVILSESEESFFRIRAEAPDDLLSFPRGQFHRLQNFCVTRAAAEIAGQGLADFIARGMGIPIQQCLSSKQNPRDTVATLGGSKVRESFLQRMGLAVLHHAFNRDDLRVFRFNPEHKAR